MVTGSKSNWISLQLPLSNTSYWKGISDEVCNAVLANDARNDPENPAKRIRSVVQAYYQPPNQAWKPMGAAFRRIISCPVPR